MPAVDAVAAHIGAPCFPWFERALDLPRNALIAPYRQSRALYQSSGLAVCLVGFVVVRPSGAIIVAGGVHMLGSCVVKPVFRKRVVMECCEIPRFCPACQRVVEKRDRSLLDQHLRQRMGLCEKQPVICLHRKGGVEALPHVEGGNDIEHHQGTDALRRIERHSIGDPAPAIVTGDAEAGKAERRHDFE